MKQKVLAATIAGGLLVGAGFITAAISTPGAALAQDDSTDSPEETHVHVPPLRDHSAILEDVLSDLVADGTIDQSQADAILEAVATKAEEVRADAQALREMIERFLQDDVITADELAQLPDDHPFNDPDGVFADALEDGQITRAEIQEARPGPRFGPFRRGLRLGAVLDDGGIDQEEYDALPDDHPLKQVDASDALADGIITLDELKDLIMSQNGSGTGA